MNEFYLLMSEPSDMLRRMAEAVLSGEPYVLVDSPDKIPELKNKKLIFAAELNSAGIDLRLWAIISKLCCRGAAALAGSIGAVIVRSESELYTKSAASSIVYLANNLGCSFPGHPLVEATEGLRNFLTWQKTMDISLEDICIKLCGELGKRLRAGAPARIERPNIAAIHSSQRSTSNTLRLWRMVCDSLSDCIVNELHVKNGEALDCRGCSYRACVHYGMKGGCFYGGAVVENIYPAVERADAMVWICPNYNDNISANLIAVINRLTALYRKISFRDKSLFAVIVSGNSGGDSVAKQLIGSLNINKGFRLPPYFSLTATANDPGAIEKVQRIDEKARMFARNIIDGTGSSNHA